MQTKPEVEEMGVRVVVLVSDTIPILCRLCQESPMVKPFLFKDRLPVGFRGRNALRGPNPGDLVGGHTTEYGGKRWLTVKANAEVELSPVEGLLKACTEIRNRWGYPEVLGVWLADQERFSPILVDFNYDRKAWDALIVSNPHDFERPNRSEIYLQRIFELLRPGRSGEKRLFLGGCNMLKGCLRDLPHDAAQTGQVERWPAAAAWATLCTRCWS